MSEESGQQPGVLGDASLKKEESRSNSKATAVVVVGSASVGAVGAGAVAARMAYSFVNFIILIRFFEAAITAAVGAAGFGSTGVVAGSVAAGLQGSSVAAGSLFAAFQSIGATGSLAYLGGGAVGKSLVLKLDC